MANELLQKALEAHGFAVQEIDSWRKDGEARRGLRVTYRLAPRATVGSRTSISVLTFCFVGMITTLEASG